MRFLVFCCLGIVFIGQSSAVTPVTNLTDGSETMVSASFLEEELRLQDFYDFTPKKYKEATGKRMKLKDRAFLMYIKKDLQSRERKGEDFGEGIGLHQEERRFHLGGFLLGLIFGIFGVLLSLLWRNKNVRRSAWKGFLLLIILTIVGFLLG